MDGLSSWTHCFLTLVPLGELPSFEYDAEADTCWCANCPCSSRAACLEVRAASLCYALVSGSEPHPSASIISAWLSWCHLQSFLPQDVYRPQGLWIRMAQVPAHVWSSTSTPSCPRRPVPSPWSCLDPYMQIVLDLRFSFPCAIWFPFGLPNQFPVLAHSQKHNSLWGRSHSFWVRCLASKWSKDAKTLPGGSDFSKSMCQMQTMCYAGSWEKRREETAPSHSPGACPQPHTGIWECLLLVPAWVTANTLGHCFWACPAHRDGLDSRIHCSVNCVALGRLSTSPMMPHARPFSWGLLETGLLR